MTDESRFRAPRPIGQPQPSTAASTRVRRPEDPLAELARLIGQEDPFADFVAHRPADARSAGNLGIQRRTRPQEGRGYEGRPAERIERRRPLPPRTPEHSFDETDTQDFPDASHTNGGGAYAYGGSRAPRADDLPPQRTSRDDSNRAFTRAQPRADTRGTEEVFHEQDRPAPVEARQTRRAPARPESDESAYDQYAGTDYDPDYADDGYLPAHGDEFYEEAPRGRVKTWMFVGIFAVALVVLGISGLFAYRAVFGVTGSGAPPVTIRPEAGPTKLVPGSSTKAAAEGGGNKQIYDRVGGDAPQSGERIVSREERPIDPASAAAAAPATRMPGGTVAAIPPAAPAQAAPAPVLTAPASTEPRRVRTVTVRADGTVVSDPARSAAPAPTPPPAPRAAPVASAPLALNSASSAAPPARPAGSAVAPQSGDNPWASVTNSGQLSAPAVNSQAALSPQSASAANPAPIVAVQTPPPAGSYVVQVAAQKSEAEAAATWQQLQQRYAAVLGGQQATIRRVDLGERGVFYRAQVGPFASRSQASEVCQSLKAAGGECVIQRN
jgi:hypothetical protein